MTERNKLKIGAFYWVMPANDPDSDEAWERDEQPARFAGYNGEGQPTWHCLNVEDISDWPMRWIGDEIVRS